MRCVRIKCCVLVRIKCCVLVCMNCYILLKLKIYILVRLKGRAPSPVASGTSSTPSSSHSLQSQQLVIYDGKSFSLCYFYLFERFKRYVLPIIGRWRLSFASLPTGCRLWPPGARDERREARLRLLLLGRGAAQRHPHRSARSSLQQ